MFVCKPLRTPFDDGTTALVGALVKRLPHTFKLTYFGDPSEPLRPQSLGHVIATSAMGHAPTLRDKLRVLAVLTQPRRARLPLHLFFTPNRSSSGVLALLKRLQPKRTMLQSLMSSHGVADMVQLLRPLDRVVVLSDSTRQNLITAGMEEHRVVRIYPGVEHVARGSDSRSRQMVYAGDLDAMVVERLIAIACAMASRNELADWKLIIACRPKAEHDKMLRARLASAIEHHVRAGRVTLLGHVDDVPALLRGSALQLYVADHVRRKVDLPLVLLEGLAHGIGLIAMDGSPLSEMFVRAREHGLEVGTLVAANAMPGTRDTPEMPTHGELIAAICRATSSPETLLRWGADARTLIDCEFSIGAMIERYVELYQEVARQ